MDSLLQMVAAMLQSHGLHSTLLFKNCDPTGLLGYIDQKSLVNLKAIMRPHFLYFINFIEKTMLLGNAGHPYFIYAKGEDSKKLKHLELYLDLVLHDPVAQTLTFKYESGDRFFIYTDGLVENVNSKEELLESIGLLRILNQNRHGTSLRDFKESVISEIISFWQIRIY